MTARLTRHLATAVTAALVTVTAAIPAFAQAKPRPRSPSTATRQSRGISIHGYVMVGKISFAAAESFDTILGKSSGPVVGGGARVGLPWGGLFVDIGGWRYRDAGERVFIFNRDVIPLNIPVTVTVTPIEVSAGWRFRFRRLGRLVPYASGGLTSWGYSEASDFSTPAEDVTDRFTGVHLVGGAEYSLTRWLGVAGEASWTTVPDAIGTSGVARTFNETDLGGSTVRLKITIGR